MYSFLSFYFILLGSINFLNPRLLVYLSRDSFSLVASVCFPFSSVCSIPPSIFYSSGLIAMKTSVYTFYRMFLFFLQLQKNSFAVCWNRAWYCLLEFEIHCFVTSWIFKVFLDKFVLIRMGLSLHDFMYLYLIQLFLL